MSRSYFRFAEAGRSFHAELTFSSFSLPMISRQCQAYASPADGFSFAMPPPLADAISLS
jgi:hypothetical protein